MWLWLHQTGWPFRGLVSLGHGAKEYTNFLAVIYEMLSKWENKMFNNGMQYGSKDENNVTFYNHIPPYPMLRSALFVQPHQFVSSQKLLLPLAMQPNLKKIIVSSSKSHKNFEKFKSNIRKLIVNLVPLVFFHIFFYWNKFMLGFENIYLIFFRIKFISNLLIYKQKI